DDVLVVSGGASAENYSLETYDGGAGRDLLAADGAVVFNGSLTSIEGFSIGDGASLTIGWATGDAMPDEGFLMGGAFTETITIQVATASTVNLSQWRFNSWTDGVDRLTVTGSSSTDVFTGTSRGDSLMGQGGNDTLAGGAGADLLDGGAGTDT